MKAPPFFPIYPADFRSDDRFAFLSIDEIGAVFLLLMWQWETGSIPDDPAKLAIICRTSKEVISTLYPAIKGAFDQTPNDGQMRNRWLHETRQKLLSERSRMADGGRAGMKKRWAPDKGVISRLGEGNNVVITTETETDTKKEKTPPISPPAHAGGDPNASSEAFSKFWSAYPKKRSKGQALKAWKQLRPSKELVDRILSAIEKAKASPDWTRDGGAYIPYPATWLRAMGWEDDYSTAKPTLTKAEIHARIGAHRDSAPPPPPPKRDPKPPALRADPQAEAEYAARLQRLIHDGEIDEEQVNLCLRLAVPFCLLDDRVWVAVPAGNLFMAQETILSDLMTAGIRLTTPEEARDMLAFGAGAEDVPEEVMEQGRDGDLTG